MRPIPLAVLLFVASASAVATAQCPLEWTSGGPQRELTGSGQCSAIWDPDGAGPLPQRLVVGGTSLAGGSASGQRVMTWDGAHWEPLAPGPGTSGGVTKLTVWNGELFAAGDFNGGGLDRVARWDGSAWQPLAAGFPGTVRAMAVCNGNLVVAGDSTTTFGVPVIRTWNGASWSALPAPPTLRRPQAIVQYQGLLCVAGEGLPSSGVLERWNGSSWAISILANDVISCLAVRTSLLVGGTDTLYAAGKFTTIGVTAASRIAATTGGVSFSWSSVAGGLPAPCVALHVRNSGASYVLTASVSAPSYTVRRLVGSGGTWTFLGPYATSMSYANGIYWFVDTSAVDFCHSYDGTTWHDLHGPGVDDEVRATTCIGADVVVGGWFSTIGDIAASRIARWNGTSFQPLGLGVSGTVAGSTRVDALATLPDGSIVAGGLFTTAGTVTANCIARWDGTSWSAFGGGVNQVVSAIARLPNGDLVAGGNFTTAGGQPCSRIARWNGAAWLPLGSGINGPVEALLVRSDGVLFAGGTFSSAGGVPCANIAQWNGTSWAPVGAGCSGSVLDMAERPTGDLVVVGAFTTAGGLPADRCARWTSFGWIPMGTSNPDPGAVRAVTVLPDGDVIVAHQFHPPTGVFDEGLSRWDGATWSAVGSIEGAPSQSFQVSCLSQTADGQIVVGGNFFFASGVQARNLTKARSTCAASAQTYGTGCSSAAGPLVLSADTLPWIGSTLRTTTTGVAAGSLCLGVIGLSQLAIPLPLLLPEGQPGCSLLSALDITLLLTTGPGNTATSSFALANDPALIGVPFFQQTIPFEFDLSGAVVAVRGSNALSLVIGTL